MAACPGEDSLLAFVHGSTSGRPSPEAAEIHAHLDRCARCRLAIAQVARALGPAGQNETPQAQAQQWPWQDLPERFDDYRLVRPLGQGGMGMVWLAHDQILDRPVAIKLLLAQRPDEQQRQRFLVEGRAIARLHHPGIVTVHRVGEVAGRPYLVTEFVRGEDLRALAKPVPWPRALQIGIGLADGLAAAHRQGILHRDIKPANAMLPESGEVKLLDFGLAKLGREREPAPAGRPAPPSRTGLTEAGAIVGTPLYMAPEVRLGQPATPASDVYSLGAVLYELCTGHPPALDPASPHPASAADAQEGPGPGPPPLARRAPGVSPAFAAVIDRCLRAEPGRRFARGADLHEALVGLLPAAPAQVPAGNPYRGLLPFGGEHRGLFFGRGAEVREATERLRGASLVIVAGESGLGKSSLCQAGVLPALEEEALAQGRPLTLWRCLPGRRPLSALAAALAPALSLGAGALTERLRDDPAAVAREISGRVPCGLLFVDQLEELFTLGQPAEADAAGEALGHLTEGPSPPVRVLATVRIDFLSRLAALPGIGAEVGRSLLLLRPLSPADAREVITGPARRAGGRFESAAMVDELLSSYAHLASGLPLLQFTLAALWEARDPESGVIPAAALRDLGGVSGALARHADGVLSALTEAERGAARRLLLQLSTEGGARARRTRAELGADAPPGAAALEALVRGRLLCASESEGEAAYEVAHEALLRDWATLRGWLDADRLSRPARARVAAAAAEWERLGRAPEALWQGRQLREVAAIPPDDLLPREGAFLAASRDALIRRRRRRWVAGLALPILVGAAIAGSVLKSRHDLSRAVAGHVATARVAQGEAEAALAEMSARRGQAWALFDAPPGPGKDRRAAEALWAAAGGSAERAEDALVRAGLALEAALSLSPRDPATRGQMADVLLSRALLADGLHREAQRNELARRLAAYDADGARRRVLEAPAALRVQASPPAAQVTLLRYADDPGQGPGRRPVAARSGAAPFEAVLAPGSYLLEVNAPGRAPVRLPLLLGRGESRQLDLSVPAAVPEGYVYVPPGDFLFGSADPDILRADFLGAPPLHRVRTAGYLIGRTEVTFAAWIAFLRDLPPEERARRMPDARSLRGRLRLSEVPGRGLRFTLRTTTQEVAAYAGEPVAYRGRTRRQRQDWLRFPASGISREDALAYLAWLDRTGRLPGARLCDEHEWERAARGADGRNFPHGDRLDPDDANFDETYDRQGFGPDEVGAHPASASPFGVLDAAGNVWEWVRSIWDPAEAVIRGGAWYYDRFSNRSNNREVVEPQIHDLLLGLRVCAPAPERDPAPRP